MTTTRNTKDNGPQAADLTKNPMYKDVLKYAAKYGLTIISMNEALTTHSLYITIAAYGVKAGIRVSDHAAWGGNYGGDKPGIAIRKAEKHLREMAASVYCGGDLRSATRKADDDRREAGLPAWF
jgi:hypothetical protein